MKMLNHILLLFFATVVCFSTAFAGDLEDANDAVSKGDYATALIKYRIPAAQGNATAQYKLGSMYVNSLGVTQDYKEAVRWFRLSAAQGDSNAQDWLGYMYENGQGVVQDYSEAVRWYKLSAAQGNVSAQSNLGFMYGSGKGLIQNKVRAHMWHILAAVNGDKIHVHNRDASKSNWLTPQQIADAQKLARECQARNFKNCN
jgi:TPR repeat protein